MEKEITRIVEAILFASGKWLSVEEITRLSREKNEVVVLDALKELQKEYETRKGAIQLENEEKVWKFHVKPEHTPYIKKIVTQTELTKSVLETLAIIAARVPVLQSTIIKIRTNKAYDHLSLLEDSGYISRKKEGRTKRIMLADKFFEYFDVPKEKIVERFKKANNIETEVRTKEERIQAKKEEFEEQQEKIRIMGEERKEENQKIHETLSKEVETLKQKAQTIPTPTIIPEHLGPLEIVNIPETTNKERDEIKQEDKENSSQIDSQFTVSGLQKMDSGSETRDTKQETEDSSRPSVDDSSQPPVSGLQFPVNTSQEENNTQEVKSETQEEKDKGLPSSVDNGSQFEADSLQKSDAGHETREYENVRMRDSGLGIKDSRHEPEEGSQSAVGDSSQDQEKMTLAERIETEAQKKAQTTPTKSGTGLYPKGIPPEVEKIIDKKAKKIMTGIEEENEGM